MDCCFIIHYSGMTHTVYFDFFRPPRPTRCKHAFSLPLILVVSYFTGDIQKAIEYEGWGNPMFFVQFRIGYRK